MIKNVIKKKITSCKVGKQMGPLNLLVIAYCFGSLPNCDIYKTRRTPNSNIA